MKRRRHSRLLSCLLALAMVFCILPTSALAAGQETEGDPVTTYAELTAAIASATAGSTIYVAGVIEMEDALTVNAQITFTGGGTLVRKYDAEYGYYAGRFFTLTNSTTATLENIVLDGAGGDLPCGPLIYVEDGAALLLRDGAVLTNNAGEQGGAIYVESGAVNMEGGSVCGNRAYEGGAVFVNGGAGFSMSGGSLSGNSAENSGGAICSYGVNSGGNITISGGSVSNNSATGGNGEYGDGGGVYLLGSSFSMTGGSVSDNMAAGSGGGVYIGKGGGLAGEFDFSGGSIYGNSAAYGGGVYSAGNPLTLSGGSIEANTATGGGVYYQDSGSAEVPRLSGGITITGNLDTEGAASNLCAGQSSPNPPEVTGPLWGSIGLNASLCNGTTPRVYWDSAYSGTNDTKTTDRLSFYCDTLGDASGYAPAAAETSADASIASDSDGVTFSSYTDLSGKSHAIYLVQKDMSLSECFSPEEYNYVHLTGGGVRPAVTRSAGFGDSFVRYTRLYSASVASVVLDGESAGATAPALQAGADMAVTILGGVKICNNVNGGSVISGGGVCAEGDLFILGGEISGNNGPNGYYSDGGDFSTATASFGGGGVWVGPLSNCVMNGGVMSGNETTWNQTLMSTGGGGVYIYGGDFILNGGLLSQNSQSGVYINSAADAGRFAMNGGRLSGNTSSGGGGVYVTGAGSFSMSGGDISANKSTGTAATFGGGGVYVNADALFTLYSGRIENNTSLKYGGGVFVYKLNNYIGSLIMYGGSISGNSAASNGGGVYNLGSTRLLGGEITGNSAVGDPYSLGSGRGPGGGVFSNSPNGLSFGGEPVVSGNMARLTPEAWDAFENNVYLYWVDAANESVYAAVESGLGGSAKVGLTIATLPTTVGAVNAVPTGPIKAIGGAAADCSDSFTSDNEYCYTAYSAENHAIYLARTTYPVTLPASGTGFTAYGVGDKTAVDAGASYRFCVEALAGYTWMLPDVTAGGQPLTPESSNPTSDEGKHHVYETGAVTADRLTDGALVIAVTAKEDAYIVTPPLTSGAYAFDGAATVKAGEDYSFTVTLNSGYEETAPTVNIAGKTQVLTASSVNENVYTYTIPAENITADFGISVRATLNASLARTFYITNYEGGLYTAVNGGGNEVVPPIPMALAEKLSCIFDGEPVTLVLGDGSGAGLLDLGGNTAEDTTDVLYLDSGAFPTQPAGNTLLGSLTLQGAVTSASTDCTVYLNNTHTTGTEVFALNAEVSNIGGAPAVYIKDDNMAPVSISGGSYATTGDYAVEYYGGGGLTIGGAPGFSAADSSYDILAAGPITDGGYTGQPVSIDWHGAETDGVVVVKGGAANKDKWQWTSGSGADLRTLVVSGLDLVIGQDPSYHTYVITKPDNYVVRHGEDLTTLGSYATLQSAIDAIDTRRAGGSAYADCIIDFQGTGDAALNILADTAELSHGSYTLHGKLTGSGNVSCLSVKGGATVATDAVITSTAANGCAVQLDNGNLHITGGEVSNNGEGRAIYVSNSQSSRGELRISGGTVSSQGKASPSQGTGGEAISYSSAQGSVVITGGAVSSARHCAIRFNQINSNYCSASLHISQDSESNPTLITSGGKYTIYMYATGLHITLSPDTLTKLSMSGGCVENTGTSSYEAIHIVSATGQYNFTGGRVSAPASALWVSGYGTGSQRAVVNIGGTAQLTASDAGANCVNLSINAELTMTGGSVKATGTDGVAIYSGVNTGGAIKVKGGTVESTQGHAIYNNKAVYAQLGGGETRAAISSGGGSAYYMNASGAGASAISAIVYGNVDFTSAADCADLRVGDLIQDYGYDGEEQVTVDYFGTITPYGETSPTPIVHLDTATNDAKWSLSNSGRRFVRGDGSNGTTVSYLYAELFDPNVFTYIITANGTGGFNVRNGVTPDPATIGSDGQSITEAISAIEANRGGADCTLVFGAADGNTTLDAGAATVPLTTGKYTLKGSLTGSATDANSGVVKISNVATVESAANISNTNTAGTPGQSAVYNSGTLTITDGLVSGGTGTGSTSSQSISSKALHNAGTLYVAGGQVRAVLGQGVYNAAGAAVTVSGGKVTNAAASGFAAAIHNGGTNASVTVSDGIVETTGSQTGNGAYAIRNHYATGTVTVSGGAVKGTGTGGGILNCSSGLVTISGGTVSAVNGRAVFLADAADNSQGNLSVGSQYENRRLNMTGGEIRSQKIGIENNSVGYVDISGSALVVSGGSAYYSHTIYSSSAKDVSVSGSAALRAGGSNAVALNLANGRSASVSDNVQLSSQNGICASTGNGSRLAVSGNVEFSNENVNGEYPAGYSAGSSGIGFYGSAASVSAPLTSLAISDGSHVAFNNATGVSLQSYNDAIIHNADFTFSGTGLLVQSSSANTAIDGCTFTGTANTSKGVRNTSTGTLTLTACAIDVSTAQNVTGGAGVENSGTGTVNILGGSITTKTGKGVANTGGGAVTLDNGVGGNTLTITAIGGNAGNAALSGVCVYNEKGTATINGGVYDADGNGRGPVSTGVYNSGTLHFNDGTVYGGYYAVRAAGSDGGATNLRGGVFTGAAPGMASGFYNALYITGSDLVTIGTPDASGPTLQTANGSSCWPVYVSNGIPGGSGAVLVMESGLVEFTGSSQTYAAIYSASKRAIEIKGGTVRATGTSAALRPESSPVTVSGGDIDGGAGGNAVILDTGKLTMTGGVITASGGKAAIHLPASYSSFVTGTRLLEVSAGTVSNTGSGYAIDNASRGEVCISGGTVSAAGPTAINQQSPGKLFLTGSPVVSGTSCGIGAATAIDVDSSFAPATPLTVLYGVYGAAALGGKTVVRGSGDTAKWTLVNSNYSLKAASEDGTPTLIAVGAKRVELTLAAGIDETITLRKTNAANTPLFLEDGKWVNYDAMADGVYNIYVGDADSGVEVSVGSVGVAALTLISVTVGGDTKYIGGDIPADAPLYVILATYNGNDAMSAVQAKHLANIDASADFTAPGAGECRIFVLSGGSAPALAPFCKPVGWSEQGK